MKLNKEQETNMLNVYGTYSNYYRSIRKRLLQAFDIYKTNVIYGIINESEEQKKEVLKWYKNILDLEENSLDNVPECIKRYL